MEYRVRRREATMNTIPPKQNIIEIMRGPRSVEIMGSWTTLCLPEGAVNAMDATDEQILDAFINDESVYSAR